MSKDETLDHPSYGLVQFSHVTGHRRLFGSSLDTHERTVCLSIKHASLIRNDSGDRYSGLIDGDMVEVHMSAAQFAELLTTMNIGSGVPCTITRVNRQTVAPPPEVDHQTKSVQNKFADRMQDLASKILADSAEVQTLLEKKSLNVADRNRLQGVFKKLSMELNSNAPFFLEMFEEAIKLGFFKNKL